MLTDTCARVASLAAFLADHERNKGDIATDTCGNLVRSIPQKLASNVVSLHHDACTYPAIG
jgi:hypothetical protein